MQIIFHWILATAAILIAVYLLPGVGVTLLGAIVLAVVLALFRMVLKPLLVVLTLPLTVFTLGLFLFVINALLVMLAAYVVPGFMVDGFWSALFFSIVVSLINFLFGQGWKL